MLVALWLLLKTEHIHMGKPWNNESRVSREVVGMRPPCAPYDSAPEGARSEREGAPHDLKNQDAVDPTRHATESAAVDPLLNPSLTRTLLLRLSLYRVWTGAPRVP